MRANSQESPVSTELVTVLGGAGFMGSHICRGLLNRGKLVRVFDRVEPSSLYPGTVESIVGDVAQPPEVMRAISDADIVVDLIHTTVPGSSMKDPVFDVASNVVSKVSWLQHLKRTRVRKVIYVSSGGTVYGSPQSIPITENHPTDPICSYGITKLAIEKYVALYAGSARIDYRILRPSNVYGPGQQLHLGQGVIGVLASKAINSQELEIWGTGDERRDYLFIDDLVDAFNKILDYEGTEHVFNVSSCKGHSVNDIICLLKKHLRPFPRVVYADSRGFDVPVNILDSSLLQQLTGWAPQTDLEEGLARTVEWLKKERQQSISAND
jgi:UDP-glucose 4-epimerase